jgi:signal transduction histidine kinase
MTIWVLVSMDYLPDDPDTSSADVPDAAGALLVIDLVLGFLALFLLPLRRRWPLLIAVLTTALGAVSGSSLGAAALATVSMSTRRRWRDVVLVGGLWGTAALAYELLLRTNVPGVVVSRGMTVLSLAFSIAVYAILVTTGFYIGARRELLASLRQRAENAEREQVLRADAAREAERTRIAREMHDVLAHRISLVAVHAGALSYRTDLSREEVTRTAGVIADNAHLALTELRQVLGVLRGEAFAEGVAEPPQPTLGSLPELLDAATAAGTQVSLDRAALQPDRAVSDTVSRTAYRIIQEGLTNARKHAPHQPVHLRLAHSRRGLEIELRNPGDVSGPAASPPPGSGTGLLGLGERAALAGGSLSSAIEPDGTFVLRAWLPCP